MLLGGPGTARAGIFLIWGAPQGIYLCINHLWRGWRGGKPEVSMAGLMMKGACWPLSPSSRSWSPGCSFAPKTAAGAWQMLQGLFEWKQAAPLRIPGILAADGFADAGGRGGYCRSAAARSQLALAMALGLPNVLQLFRYREYRRAPDRATHGYDGGRMRRGRCCRQLALAISLFGMWQRLEFLYQLERDDFSSIFFLIPELPGKPLILNILQNARDAFISSGSSLEPGRICMISMYSQIAPSRPKPMLDACLAL